MICRSNANDNQLHLESSPNTISLNYEVLPHIEP